MCEGICNFSKSPKFLYRLAHKGGARCGAVSSSDIVEVRPSDRERFRFVTLPIDPRTIAWAITLRHAEVFVRAF
jgi:hypothetical protein